MNKPIYLGLSILEISKILMYEFWYDYMKPKYNDHVRLCYMDTDSFIMNIKTNDFYNDIANDVENRFDTSNYEVNRPLPTGKNKKIIGLMKDELGGKIITEFVTLRPKTYSFLTDDGKEDKKAKGTKKCVIKKMIKFNDYKKCLLNGEVMLKPQQRFISKKHDVYTENINKIALSNNDDKRIVLSNKITSYPYGYVLKSDIKNLENKNYKIVAKSNEYFEESDILKKINNTNNQKIQELENYFNDNEENKIETEKKFKESKILNDKLIKEKEEIIKELDNKEKLINEYESELNKINYEHKQKVQEMTKELNDKGISLDK